MSNTSCLCGAPDTTVHPTTGAARCQKCLDDETIIVLKNELARVHAAAVVVDDAIVNRVLLAVCNMHDGSDLWAHTRREPDAFRDVVRRALGVKS